MAGTIQISRQAPELVAESDSSQAANQSAQSDLWIFREGRREVSGPQTVRSLQERIDSGNDALDCLIEAGQLEAALADLNDPGTSAAASLTDALASQYLGHATPEAVEELARRLQAPKIISISPPEGFSYYALHPSDYARAIDRLPVRPSAYAVIGIRSIGTSLSAMTAAALKRDGRAASRITVRPAGHPYARSTHFTLDQERWIAEEISRSAHFLVVDEGPGRSGSTFLSVAEALVGAGVRRDDITVLGSREFDPASLCAENAVARWRGVSFLSTAAAVNLRFENFPYLGGGGWRQYVFSDEGEWPESWTQMERLKFLSPDRRQFFKFEGMGPLGSEVRSRAFVLAAAGLSPAVSDTGDGFVSYANIEGRSLRRDDVSDSVLERIAQYCSFRVSEFACAAPQHSELSRMLEYNVQQEFGQELKLNGGELASAREVLTDGRMQPFEWIAARQGQLLKTDGINHGDNHFFPGPCDIAWDLAGVIVEWDLDANATEFLLRRFRQISGIDVSATLDIYRLAYCVFRLGFCKMARSTVLGSPEELRLTSAYHRYRSRAAKLLGLPAA
ncbi:MAG TPA: hypothetical protein VHV29_06750 [Terriglobales bacterium]|jgi:hypothetical protein|nr:hypothetical protein [Terriglobales bacterium]